MPIESWARRGFLLLGGVNMVQKNRMWGFGMKEWLDWTVDHRIFHPEVSLFSGEITC